VKKELKIVPVTTVDEVLSLALVNPLVPILKEETDDEVHPPKPVESTAEDEPLLTH
jgi:hypothetical protein